MIRKSRQSPGTYILETRILLPSPVQTAFDFFSNAENLNALTPPWLHFRILTPAPIEMRAGTLIDYRLRLHGIPIGWRSEITVWEPPFRFVDTQLKGPYRLWRHEHTFVEHENGTWLGDKVDYSAFGGSLINSLFIKRDLKRIFRYRQKKLRELFSAIDKSGNTVF